MPVDLPELKLTNDVTQALGKKPKHHVEVVGPWGSAKTLVAVQAAAALGRSILVLAPGRIEAEHIQNDLATFVGEEHATLFPAWEVLPTDSMSPADDIVAERMDTLKQLALAQDAGEPAYCVAPIRSFLQKVINRKRLIGDTLTLKVGDDWPLEDLLEKLVKMGYTREVMVENRGEVSVRGGIVDIFPISSELPYRLEFFGDELESLRRFEPETQRSVSREESMQILPRSEKAMMTRLADDPHGLMPLTNYFDKDTLIVLDEPLAVREAGAQVAEQFEDNPFYLDWEEAEKQIARFSRLSLAQVGQTPEKGATRFRMPTHSLTSWAGKQDAFWEQMQKWDADGCTVRILCVNTGEQRRLLELLEEHGYQPGRGSFDLKIDLGRLRAGFFAVDEKLVVLSEAELFGRHYVRRKRRRFEAGAAITQFSDLKSGDYVVHVEHGIGRYIGLRRFENRPGDYLGVQYKGGDTVFIPVTHIDQVQKYVAGEGTVPRVDKVGGASWRTAKAKVKKAVREMTEELVKLYASREEVPGHAFNPDTPWQVEFEDAFQYDETPDQLRAIQEVKRDMEQPRPMDRLLCGDVGYGKTEVALRAAFKAVMDRKQVAVLAPTTVLTQQHFATFTERMADFPVRLAVLNRFQTPKEQRAAIDGVAAGEIDILIGTHRLLSKDVKFADLGLVIVDEEQKFGVAHKEKLKQMRTAVDVLTMSATPIPRTLHFSLIGVRDMSTINTAPNDRLPVHTLVEAWDPNHIREAIERELAREGQAFFLHNRVQTITQVTAYVNKLVPKARISFAHGQMHKHELEDVMGQFINKEIDVLVCTTIIGSGIDIPNANTIIVDRADHFGLAELYQIRGRVGRYKHRAFAYLLVPGDRALSEEAQQRLKALEEFSNLGAGFRIAMRDLEIRGAGNLLGADQSGHIVTVGYETYRQLIEEAVAEHKGDVVRRREAPPFDLNTDAHIPDEYVPTSMQKMTLYRRIANVRAVDDVDELRDELTDRFGRPPGPVKRLLDVMRARAWGAEVGARKIADGGGELKVEFESGRFLDEDVQHVLRQGFGDTLTFAWDKHPTITYKHDSDDPPAAAIELFMAMDEA
jgi:transcription-repair coupling factor (superfamily II helicase)